ncbi:zinc finger domain-containing protein [Streptomyces sp. NBC_00344]|uniref:zinc finger domain-containing protein n=1 Tax=Streptomyces sp. NBC_00344 TaxID=2975720 RepID=UPI002E22732A
MLPLEAIELDVFRRRHEHDTFWCGLLLGGCGVQLTTKLYTDRVCHFAHYPGADGLPHLCGRHARGVASADHLYVKSAAAAWLRDHDDQADFDFAQPGGAAIGSVVDIRFKHGGLRVHLDQAVAPVWDEDGREPVLGMSVPVDRDTLIHRWYVHRIRLDSEGTARRVRIGTEAFARPIEWFALDECAMTERGLSTPAVEQIVRSRRTRPVSAWAVGRTKRVPDAQARAQVLLRKLADARKVGSVVVVTRVCRDIAAVTGMEEEMQAQLTNAVSDAERWLVAQADVRRKLFSDLSEAVASRTMDQVRQLLVRVNATSSHDRTEDENVIADAAAECIAAFARQRQTAAAAKRAKQEDSAARRAAERVEALLAALERRGISQPRNTMRKLVKDLTYAAVQASGRIDSRQQEQIRIWKTRAGIGRPPANASRRTAAPAKRASPKRKPPLHEQVERRSWSKNERKPRAEQSTQRPPSQQQSPSWQVVDVACPTCEAAPGTRCRTPDGRPHQPRVRQFSRRFPSH